MDPQIIADDEVHDELINGVLITMTAPRLIHAKILAKLTKALNVFSVQNNTDYFVISSTCDILIEPDFIRLQPDLMVFKDPSKLKESESGAVISPPDVVMEIISPSSYEKDVVTKKQFYAQFNIPEYWLVFIELRLIEVWTLQNGKYALNNYALETGTVNSAQLPSFTTSIEALMDSMV